VLASDQIAAAGHAIATVDGEIAAIARGRAIALLATRDLGSFRDCGVPVIGPWRPYPVSVPGAQACL